ncbi:MAG: anhydro-N-acetylmuramic acid kinase [Rhodobacterales bacterium]|nr:MAG: anhydro-N-acetylmuramic acid kinase [Rhodobacterales bacterium]
MKLGGMVKALGAMSGTSADGVDAALIETDGETIAGFGESGFRPYSADEARTIRRAFGRWPGEAPVEAAAQVVEAAHVALLRGFEGAELVGFHGQTLAHDPKGRGTHQAGDGQRLADALGLPVVWDFRTSDVALGGEGAPLAPFFHFALARHIGATGPVAFLNLGGVGNITWVDPTKDRPDAPGALLAFDTGPANGPIDDFMRRTRGRVRDEGGAYAATGEADRQVIADFLGDPYFLRVPPKSLDRNHFAGLGKAVRRLKPADAAATLTLAAAAAVIRGFEHLPEAPGRLLVAGGGRRNATLMGRLDEMLKGRVEPVEAAGLDGDMLEAQAFGFLAVRVARGLATSCPGTTGVAAAVGGGIVSQPG